MDTRTAPQQRRSRDKRDRILQAAADLLQELPYDAVGTKLIANRAGVSVGSLYRFFIDKQAIVDALVLRWLDQLVEIMDELLADPPADPALLLDRLVDTYATFWRDRPGFRAVEAGAVHYRLAPGTGDATDAQLVDRLHAALTGRYALPSGADFRRRLLIAVNVTEHLLNEAFRTDPQGDATVLGELKVLVRRYLGLG